MGGSQELATSCRRAAPIETESSRHLCRTRLQTIEQTKAATPVEADAPRRPSSNKLREHAIGHHAAARGEAQVAGRGLEEEALRQEAVDRGGEEGARRG